MTSRSNNWLDADEGRALRARIQQRTDWLHAIGQPVTTERLARDLDRSAGTIARHLRDRTKKNPLHKQRASQIITEGLVTMTNMHDAALFFKGDAA
jgi:AraC-like DNA-binding protein